MRPFTTIFLNCLTETGIGGRGRAGERERAGEGGRAGTGETAGEGEGDETGAEKGAAMQTVASHT